jgi:hypothetical protein
LAGAGDYGDFIIAVPPHTLRETLANDTRPISASPGSRAPKRMPVPRHSDSGKPWRRPLVSQRITVRGRRMWP